jgi:hypothetical protein
MYVRVCAARAPQYLQAEAKQIFGEIGAVLPGHAGEERNAPLRI